MMTEFQIEGSHGGFEVGDNSPPVIVGVINLSPESFYKGSVSKTVPSVSDTVERMHSNGVDILDVGSISSRPVSLYGGEKSTLKREIKRTKELFPKLMDIASSYGLPVAMDTQHSEVAEIALQHGATIINDISGLKNDPEMVTTITDHDAEIVLMATHDKAGDSCGIEQTMADLSNSVNIAVAAGILREKIVIDPAFGGWQGKNRSCDLNILRNFDKLRALELPVYIGISRKSTIHTLGGGKEPEDRLAGSLILTNWLIDRGAHIIRTHDVKETRNALNVRDNLKNL